MKYLSSIVSCSIGNILEWYDFGLFAIFSTLFSRLFFPTEDPKTALVATVGIFSLGFVCRPIGALIFGYMGDKKGRAKTLRFSILMIVLPTLLIGCLPTYQQLGITATILLTLIRMWQGISIGGEYSGSLIYLAETAPKNKRATFTSIANIGANLGILLAAIVGTITSDMLSTSNLESWGWRVAYILSGIIGIIIYTFRLRIHETTIFIALKHSKKLVMNPISNLFKNNILQLLRTVGMTCMGSTFYFFCFIYLPIYFTQTLQFSIHHISLLISSLIGLMIFLVPIAGYICDKLGRRKMLLFNAVLITLCIIPGCYFLTLKNNLILDAVMLIFTIASSLEQGTTPIAIIENFPAMTRYSGVSLGYNIGNGFLGGTVPIICGWLLAATHFTLAPALYITLCAVITGVVIYCWVPETQYTSLK